MLRLCVGRRRRHAAVAASLALVIASSLLLIGQRDNIGVGGSDYDPQYDAGDDADVARVLLIHKREVPKDGATSHQEHSDLRVRSSFKTDRKPQGQTDYDPEENGLYHRRVIFNKENLPVMAKRLAFVQTHTYEAKNIPEDDDDYAEGTDDDVRNNDDVIGEDDDVTNEDEAEDEYEYWDNPNPVFKPGDFDRRNSTKPPFKFQDVKNSKLSRHKAATKHKLNKQNKPQGTLNTSVPGSRVLQSKTFLRSSDTLKFKPRPQAKKLDNEIRENSEIYRGNNGLHNGNNGGVPPYEQPATQLQMPALLRQPGEVNSRHGYPVVREHIYWSEEVESFVPKGKNYETMEEDMGSIRLSRVQTMKEPQWNRCGRPLNQYIVMDTGRALCARYRDPHNKLIYGELLSFYLSRMLGFDNIPIVVLSEVNSSAPQWRGQELQRAQWKEGRIVALIEWIKGLDEERSRVKMPPVILSAYEQGLSVTGQHPALSRMSKAELAELLQWGDMVILDYITGHYDRVASMQDGADRESKPSILSENIRNLRKVPETGKMWLIDNESGLLDAYELMYKDVASGSRFLKFHSRMLRTMCIFRKSLIRKVKALASHADPASVLLHFTKEYEPYYEKLPKVSAFHLFEMHFHSRLKEVTKWVSECTDR